MCCRRQEELAAIVRRAPSSRERGPLGDRAGGPCVRAFRGRGQVAGALDGIADDGGKATVTRPAIGRGAQAIRRGPQQGMRKSQMFAVRGDRAVGDGGIEQTGNGDAHRPADERQPGLCEGRGKGERLPHGRVEGAEPGPQESTQRIRQGGKRLSRPPGTDRDGALQLESVERIPGGDSHDLARLARGNRSASRSQRREDGVVADGSHLENGRLATCRTQPGHVASPILPGPEAREEAHGLVAKSPRHEPERGRARLVHPVGIVDHEQQRSVASQETNEAKQPDGHGQKLRGPLARGTPLEGDLERRTLRWRQQVRHAIQHRVNEIEQRAERQHSLGDVGVRVEDAGAVRLRRGYGDAEQRGLPDAHLATKQQAGRAERDPVHELPERGRLSVTTRDDPQGSSVVRSAVLHDNVAPFRP